MYIPEGVGTVFPYIFASDAAAYVTGAIIRAAGGR